MQMAGFVHKAISTFWHLQNRHDWSNIITIHDSPPSAKRQWQPEEDEAERSVRRDLEGIWVGAIDGGSGMFEIQWKLLCCYRHELFGSYHHIPSLARLRSVEKCLRAWVRFPLGLRLKKAKNMQAMWTCRFLASELATMFSPTFLWRSWVRAAIFDVGVVGVDFMKVLSV